MKSADREREKRIADYYMTYYSYLSLRRKREKKPRKYLSRLRRKSSITGMAILAKGKE